MPWAARSQFLHDQALMSESAIPAFCDAVLYQRGRATLIASWETYARAAAGAVVRHGPGVTAAIFPHGPERAVYNNALLAGGLSAAGRSVALETMAERVYAAVGFRDLGRILEYVPHSHG